jgi:uncharacterized protein
VSRESRYVFDTSATISALLLDQGTPALAFYAAINEGELLLSDATFVELSETLAKPKFDRYVTKDEREQFLVKLLLHASLVEINGDIHACRDPKDDKFLEMAISANATCVVTGDADLLVLSPFRGIPILTPRQFLDFLAAKDRPSA